jgi:chromosome segregation protein
MNQIKLEMNSSERELSDLYEKKKALQQKVSEHEKMYFEARAIIHDKEENWKNQQKLNNQQIQLLFQLEQKFNEIKLQIQGIAERVKMEFEMNVNDLLQSASPDKDWSEDAEKNVEKLRRILNEFGPVNEMAVEAYDEARERLNFIQLQKNDLMASKDTILETLHEIDNTANQKFMAAFGTVRTNFIKVFRSLFEEDDTCDLILSDPKQPLESKIEIIAKPKGKRPLTINQLSGGEKTLTATALLFALYLLKPAPFCIFDEVDAPLDDSNISKFNHIIKDFSEQSQFIIVTHNKKTMSSVEIMYGVTMVKGISKLVPVDFRALENVLQ